MARAPLLLALLLLAPPAWADNQPTMLPGNMPSLSQGRAIGGYAPAPVPNPDARAPRGQRDPNAVELTPGLTRTNTGQGLAGDGFARGSAYNGELERRGGRAAGIGSTIAPSLNMRVPMQVDLGTPRP
jgi:hypothetical protein